MWWRLGVNGAATPGRERAGLIPLRLRQRARRAEPGIALELARAGVGQLHLVDGDVHDPATSARQLLGIRHAGGLKVLRIAGRMLGSNPHTRVTIAPCYLGADGGTELPQLRTEDLVIDATAT
jgi:tRNA A37 threonylcarbamoyladenosine dehydratase